MFEKLFVSAAYVPPTRLRNLYPYTRYVPRCDGSGDTLGACIRLTFCFMLLGAFENCCPQIENETSWCMDLAR